MHSIGFIGAGRVAITLAKALLRHGVDVRAVASRSLSSAERLAAALPACAALSAQEAVDRADLVFLTVPDDEIANVAHRLRWRPGQMVVHCSGATEVAALDPAARAGAVVGGFHPLQIFSDPELAIDLLVGSTVAIEGPRALEDALRSLADRLGMRVITLPAGARARYHAGAGYAASFLLSLLHEAVEVWRSFGVEEEQTLQALLPLARGTLASASSKGLAGALSGPISRGDVGVIERHLADLERLGPEHAAFYREMAGRQLPLAQASGRLSREQLMTLREVLGRG